VIDRRQRLKLVELDEEPVALSVVEDGLGRVSFSDLPERLVPSLIETFGAKAVDMVLAASEIQREYFRALPVSTRGRPRFLDLFQSGELEARVRRVKKPGRTASYFMAAINRSDEAILGRTGVIYFVCRKGCHFCHYRGFAEHSLTAEEIAARMIALERAGADNVQWLSPSAYTGLLIEALFIAAKEGFSLPIVHKSEGEDSISDLELLDGLVDLYLPDVKFVRPAAAPRIGLSDGYPRRMQSCLKEMYRQVGPLTRRFGPMLQQGGGLLVRHLLMPGGAEEAKHVLDFLSSIDQDLPVRVMTNYEPVNEAKEIAGIDRHVTREEIEAVIDHAHELEMHRVLVG
jgi:putative pyruvate formate lyase activating enzyme